MKEARHSKAWRKGGKKGEKKARIGKDDKSMDLWQYGNRKLV